MTIKQDWHREREYLNYGRLKSIISQLRGISNQPSILSTESHIIDSTIDRLYEILNDYNLPETKQLSLQKYERIKK